MVSSLRSRRRRQTARDIQAATLRLARRHGFDVVTTGMIAAEAQVSVRTFFNYYANKEAAAVGETPEFSDEAICAFVEGTGSLHDDLARLMRTHLIQEDVNRGAIHDMIALSEEAPRLMSLFEDHLRVLRSSVASILSHRLPETDALTLDLLSQIVIAALRQAVQLWAAQDEKDIGTCVDATLERLTALCRLVCETE
ncbi:TetR/AcrR family transcriptional regulator [Cereibacter changlensis]|nr:TetR family transcriptional regulator [Cereibacter changlensis]PZX48592.1 TetR family transcriptional regulator [Cereibacter changlensis]